MDSDSKSPGELARCTTGVRIHLGLAASVPPFGGLGLMADGPGADVAAAPICSPSDAPDLEAIVDCEEDGTCRLHESPCQSSRRAATKLKLLERATNIWSRLLQHPQKEETASGRHTTPTAFRLLFHSLPKAHVGLGSGTQLSLAIAAVLRHATGQTDAIDDLTLATDIADRGKRSAVGVHGFFQGGFLIDCADDQATKSSGARATRIAKPINALRDRVDVPEDWRIARLLPARRSPGSTQGQPISEHGADGDKGVDAEQEAQLFRNQRDAFARRSHESHDTMWRLIDQEILPALHSADHTRFAAAVTEYNERSGLLFESVQGGPYSGPEITALVRDLRDAGFEGVGQSSWGDTVFVIVPHDRDADRLVNQYQDSAFIEVSRPMNAPAHLLT